ncbi:Maf-like protein [Ascidiimonas sp. W6]|uniref:Maf-like protein n=1 Tax=Ascidiimonas meishanensis TaxID=3128903 RepID=UPI0030EF40FF
MLSTILKDYHLILASGSPRRQQFFKDLGLPFEIRLKPIDEIYPLHLKRAEISDYLSKLKSEAFKGDLKKNEILITSDTIVWHQEKALGKPADEAEAFKMIQSLSGGVHEVITSVSFTTPQNQITKHAITKVYFKELSSEEILYYIKNFQPFDKAGGYGIQEWIGYIGIHKIEGSYFNVMGLPLHLVYKTLIAMVS